MFPITITNDNTLELTEEFGLTLFIPDISRRLGVMKGARNFAAGRIMNDDGNEIKYGNCDFKQHWCYRCKYFMVNGHSTGNRRSEYVH